MSAGAEQLLVAIGFIVVAAFFASLGFRYFRVPDVTLLIALGIILGPVAHLVDVHLFQSLAPFVGTVALIIILFEGGLKIHKDDLLGGATMGAGLATLVFCATALLCALVGHLVADLPPPQALLLGMSLGGAGAVIVIPLIQQMGVGSRAMTIVSVEAAVSDVFVIIGVYGLATAITLSAAPDVFLRTMAQTFSIGILAGVAAGLGWVQGLRAFKERSYEYVLTMAVLLLLYSLVEALQGSGPLAVLAFGLILGNSRKSQRLAAEMKTSTGPTKKRTWEWTPVFGGELVHLHHEVVFFIRAFFFVTLGVTLDLHHFLDPKLIFVGALLTLGVVAGRYWGVMALFSRSTLPRHDRLAISLMFPLGLAAAVVSLAPSTGFDPPIPMTETFGAYAVMAIVLTNLLAAFLVFLTTHPRFRKEPRENEREPPPSPPRSAGKSISRKAT